MVGTGNFQRFVDVLQTLVLHRAGSSRIISLVGARAQSCICWTSESRAAARAREPILAICW